MDQPGGLQAAVCLELPLNVKHVGLAIDAVGGAKEIARVSSEAVFAKDPEGLELRLRQDHFHHAVRSTALRSANFVVEIELPAACFEGDNDVHDVKKALTTAKSLGVPAVVVPRFRIDFVHRFREIADFQYYTGDSHFVAEVKRSLFAGDLAEIQRLRLAGGRGATEILPPPRFTLSTQPFYYGYKQSPYVKIVGDEKGEQRLIQTTASSRVISNILTWGEAVPVDAPAGLEKTPRANVKQCIDTVSALFAERPSYTRRALQHKLGPQMSRYLKYALPYVSYYYRSGPWRGAYIKYGFDCMRDPEMARFQVEHFRIATDEPDAELDAESSTPSAPPTSPGQASPVNAEYCFDGTNFPDVPMLQLCDIADGFLEPFINTRQLRAEVDTNDGWFDEKTIAVIRKVLRAELVRLRDSGTALPVVEREELAAEILNSQ